MKDSQKMLSSASAAKQGERVFGAPQEWREYVSGYGASVVNITITFPMHKTMFRQMVDAITVREALRQLHTEGLYNLYRGVLPPLLSKSTSTCLMFGTYSQYSRYLTDLNPNLKRDHVTVAAAFLAGCTEALAVVPFERVQVLLQDSKHNSRYRNTADALRQLAVQHGFLEYYRGLSGILLRNCPSNVIFFASREKVKDRLPPEWKSNGSGMPYVVDFLCGAVTGALISTTFYPINVTRTHMQLVVGGKFLSFFSVFRSLLKDRGWRGMFKGVHLNYSRSFLSWGIINVTYELFVKELKKKY